MKPQYCWFQVKSLKLCISLIKVQITTIIYAFSFQVFNSKRTSGRHNVVDLWIPMQTSVLTGRGICVLIIVIYWSLSAPFMPYFWTMVTLFLCTFFYLCKIENYTQIQFIWQNEDYVWMYWINAIHKAVYYEK